ncbi:hypothetical protein TRVL_06129 [Trypanosoma vivax]|nr:hypothetical protein TRVL_06129 [Trypanosoma vivax]
MNASTVCLEELTGRVCDDRVEDEWRQPEHLPPLRTSQTMQPSYFVASVPSQRCKVVAQFVRFIWTCHKNIEIPLEASLQESVELAQFVDSNASRCFLPRQQEEVRLALWELLHEASERDRSVALLQWQLDDNATRMTRIISSLPSANSTVYTHTGFTSLKKRLDANGEQFDWESTSLEEEQILLTVLEGLGRYHTRAPRHAAHCAQRPENKNRVHDSGKRLPLSYIGPSLCSQPPTKGVGTPAGSCVSREPPCGGPAEIAKNGKSQLLLAKTESLTTGCPICAADGLIRSCWVSVHLLQLMDMLAAAHLSAAPLLLPHDVVSLSPREALSIGYHIAQQQLHTASALLLSIANTPEASTSCSKNADRDSIDNMEEDRRRHNVKVEASIGTLAKHGIDICVHLLASLRCMEVNNVYVVLLHASALSFFDLHGVGKAKQLLLDFVASMSRESTKSGVCDSGGFDESMDDIYKYWVLVESILCSNDAVTAEYAEHKLMCLEQVSTGILFSAFLDILDLRDLPFPSACNEQQSPDAYRAAVHSCVRARDALDKIVYPWIVKLCDAADGSISIRGRQSLSLYWLLRGTLCYLLNALSLLSSVTVPPGSYDAEAPLRCMQNAASECDSAREFADFPLLAEWVKAIVNDSESKEQCERVCGGAEPLCGWRLRVNIDCSRSNLVLPPSQCVSNVSILPPPIMRIWLVFARALFRNVPADLVSARAHDVISSMAVQSAGVNTVGPAGVCSTGRGEYPISRCIPSKLENATKVEEAKRRAKKSVLGFWLRWHNILVAHRLLGDAVGEKNDGPSLLQSYRDAMLLQLAGHDAESGTFFMRVLQESYPLISDQKRSSCIFTSFEACKMQENTQIQKHTSQLVTEEFSVIAIDARLRDALRRYEMYCVRPVVTDAQKSAKKKFQGHEKMPDGRIGGKVRGRTAPRATRKQ